jgi:hypothetical protein
MKIKLKNKSEIYSEAIVSFSRIESTCSWCGKTIKNLKYYSKDQYAASGDFCSPAHLKVASNAAL